MTDPVSDEIQDASALSDDSAAPKKKTAKKAAKKVAKKKSATKKAAAKKTSAKKAAKKVVKKAAKKAAKKPSQAEQVELPLDEPQVKVETTESVVDSSSKGDNPSPKEVESKTTTEANEKDAKAPVGRVEGRGRVGKGSAKGEQNRQSQKDQPRFQKNKKRNKDKREWDPQKYKARQTQLEGPPIEASGMLELAPKGFGFLRVPEKDFEQDSRDVFVTPDCVRRYGLRQGVWIKGVALRGAKGPQLSDLHTINGRKPDEMKQLPHFDELKAVNPSRRIAFETASDRATTRVLDLVSPVGRGQRGLIVSPPRSGKTTLLLHTAEALRENYEEQIHLIILLIDERPEEVTEFKRSLPDAEIYASSNDQGARNHCRMAELCIERAKRLVESGEDVFILMDSITRLARAYNNLGGGGPRHKKGKNRGYQSGGIVAGALEMPRRLFAAARATRTAGSLTILATALVQTNSKADELIFQEFKGTGNMELVLDRRIAEQYLYPAVDIFKSGTRREELLLAPHQLHKIHLIRRGLAGHRPTEALERLLYFIRKFPNNNQMLLEIKG